MYLICKVIKHVVLVKLPEVKYDKETEEISVIENYNLLKVNSLPVSTTFGVFNEKHILADPTEEEEQLCISKLTVVTDGNLLFSLHKPGKLSFIDYEILILNIFE